MARAVEVAMGWTKDTFNRALSASEREADSAVLEGSPIADALFKFLWEQRSVAGVKERLPMIWQGTMTQLLDHLQQAENDLSKRDDAWKSKAGWPKTSEGLARPLAELQPHLRE